MCLYMTHLVIYLFVDYMTLLLTYVQSPLDTRLPLPPLYWLNDPSDLLGMAKEPLEVAVGRTRLILWLHMP